MEQGAWIAVWLQFGRLNPWIAAASDPPFTEHSFTHCSSDAELLDYLEAGNWSCGQAFWRGELCFMELADAGDKWLVLRGAVPLLKSVPCRWIIKHRGRDTMLELLEHYRTEEPEHLETLMKLSKKFSRHSLVGYIVGECDDSVYFKDHYQYQITTPRGELHIYSGDPSPNNVTIFGKKTDQEYWTPLQLDDDAQSYWDWLRETSIAFHVEEYYHGDGYFE